MSINEETELTVQDVADLLPTGTVDPVVAEADPTSFEPVADPVGQDAPVVEEAPVVVGEDELFDEEVEARAPVESPYDRPGKWFVVHTQSGYEKKVRQNLKSRIASMHLEERIHEVVIPMEDVVEFRNGRKATVSKKMFPGYLIVRCHVERRGGLDDISWAAIRDTPGIVNFVGSGGKPLPLGRQEVEARTPVESPYDRPGKWFVVHTQSGYEKKVRQNLESRIHSMNLEELIHEVVIPMEDVVEFR
ncbi:MAG: transcription termination/antitermination NusG family protein, partial [Actinomycetota bacterium]|nr:transcription termination/antitermination NusG family protein [Actinomycetota bacterium]